MLIELLQQIQAAGFFAQIRESTYVYPVLLWLHLIALAVWGGLMLVTDLRLLDLGSGRAAGADAVAAYRRPKQVSVLFAAVCGVLLFGAKAGQYAYNPWFWVKMLLLVLLGANYLVFRRSLLVFRRSLLAFRHDLTATSAASQAGRRKLAACVSLLLIAGSVWAARGPATIREIMHSMVDPSAEALFESVQFISDDLGIREISPQTDEDWERLQARADVLLAVPELLTVPGRRVARPRDRAVFAEAELETEPMQELVAGNRQDFALRAQQFSDAVAVVRQAIVAKDKDSLFNSLNDIDRACEGCHVRYWYPNDQNAVDAAREAGIIE